MIKMSGNSILTEQALAEEFEIYDRVSTDF